MKQPLENICWRIYGCALKNPELPPSPRSYLFICKGNICRSVFAAALAEKMLIGEATDGVTCDSAGLEVSRALPPPPEALAVAAEFGVVLDNHRSTRVTAEMVQTFDTVFAMEARQLDSLRLLFPKQRNKFFLLPLFAKGSGKEMEGYRRYNIVDPFGGDLAAFRSCYERIQNCLVGVLEGAERNHRK